MSDSSLLDFANIRPAVVNPVYPTYQRPDLNVAPARDTANKFAMAQLQLAQAKQANDFNAQADPLKIEALKAEANSRMNAASDSQKWDAWGKAQATDKSLQYALGQPDGQQDTAWQSAANALERGKIITPEKAAEIRAVPQAGRATYATEVGALARATNDYMTAYGGKGAGASGGLTTKDTVDLEKQAHIQAMDEHKADSSIDVNARTQELFGQLKDAALGKAPAAKAKPDEAAKPAAEPNIGTKVIVGLGRLAHDAVTGEGPWFGADKKTDTSGSVTKDAAAHAAALGDGKSAGSAIGYTGDPKDEKAQHDWFAAIHPGQWYVNPADGTAQRKIQPQAAAGGS